MIHHITYFSKNYDLLSIRKRNTYIYRSNDCIEIFYYAIFTFFDIGLIPNNVIKFSLHFRSSELSIQARFLGGTYNLSSNMLFLLATSLITLVISYFYFKKYNFYGDEK